MRSSMRIGVFLAFAGSAVGGLLLASSCVMGELAECYSDLACPLTMRCIANSCSCEDNRLKFCCSKFDPDADCKPTCRYEDECRAKPGEVSAVSSGGEVSSGGSVSSGVGGGGGSSAVGGAGGVSMAECEVDADCAQPADKRCGAGTCDGGRCELVIAAGPMESQVYGDCQRLECDFEGKVVTLEDPSDFYGDGRECTVDFCQGVTPANMPLPDGSACPDSGQGYCAEGTCVECIEELVGASDCKSAGLQCQYRWCVPSNICPDANTCGGLCVPCSAGEGCGSDEECLSKSCSSGGMCQLPTCDDGRKNSAETGVDCGGSTCARCSSGASCLKPSDCTSDVCRQGVCEAPTCVDGKENGDETGIDCGGSCSPC
jgi:hypothetical protein